MKRAAPLEEKPITAQPPEGAHTFAADVPTRRTIDGSYPNQKQIAPGCYHTPRRHGDH